jgi:hypothetical protein
MLSPCIWYDGCRLSPSAQLHTKADRECAQPCERQYERLFEVTIPARTRATPTAIVAATLPAPDDFLSPNKGCISMCPLEIFFPSIFCFFKLFYFLKKNKKDFFTFVLTPGIQTNFNVFQFLGAKIVHTLSLRGV